MVHKLAIIAVTGLSVCAVCIGAAAAIGGRQSISGMDWSLFDDRPRCVEVAGPLPASRDIAWDGSDHAGLALRAHASYAPNNSDTVHLSGDPQLLAHIIVDDGDLRMDCRGWRDRVNTLQITLPGRPFRKFVIAGGGSMALNRLDQPDLKVEIGGSGSIKADGKVENVTIEIGGSGDADLGHVVGRTARVDIGGSGSADIAPTEEAKVDIGGSGTVNLHSNPRQLETDIGGSGRINKIPGG